MSVSEKRILIIEDDPICSKLLSSALTIIGECFTSDNGEKGLEIALNAINSNKPFDLICLDIMLPGLNGRDVLKILRSAEDSNEFKRKNRSQIVMVTGKTDSSSILGAFNEGCEAYLMKPIDLKKLRQIVRKFNLLS